MAFLKDVCRVCLHTRIGQLCTTPWKSLIIKGIELTDRPLWDAVLRRHRINVRHAANELNWQVEDFCAEGLALKHELVRHFNEEDIRTYQLCFAIKTKPQTGLFGSIVVRSHFDSLTQTGLHAEQYEVLHTRDFNPNNKDFISFRKKVNRENLPWYLAQLCDQFYEQQATAPTAPLSEALPTPPPNPTSRRCTSAAAVSQCTTKPMATRPRALRRARPGQRWLRTPAPPAKPRRSFLRPCRRRKS